MTSVVRLVTTVDVDDGDATGRSLSALHEAELDDGRRVVLLDDRGWTTSSGARVDVEETARVVVGADELRALPHDVVLSDRV